MMSNKDKRKHNKFSKMLAFNNLLEKKGSDLEIEPPDKKLKFTGKWWCEPQYKMIILVM